MLSDTRFIAAADGTPIAWREIGTGRPLLLLHGYFAGAYANWIRPGHAAVLALAGARVIMPELRGHGESGKPHDPRAYPSDVLAQDMQALVAALALRDDDIVGYSLRARVVVRMLAHGASPRRVILGGTGLEGIVAAESRADYFRHDTRPSRPTPTRQQGMAGGRLPTGQQGRFGGDAAGRRHHRQHTARYPGNVSLSDPRRLR